MEVFIMKKFIKHMALWLACVMSINTTLTAFAQSPTADSAYRYANADISNTVIIDSAGVTINGTYYTITEFEKLLDNAVLVSDNNRMQSRAAIATTIYFIPGIGEVAIAATGVIAIAGVTIAVGTWLYNTINDWLSDSSRREIAEVRASIPSRLRNENGDVDLGKFKDKVKGKNSYKEDGGWTIDKDTAGHGGRKWKLKNKSGNRVASLGENGEVLGK